jgi:class 3 adenylate cyclase/tetratricopeptide (TPR) repeat protein
VVTVLFGDVVGFTGLAEHLDPEQVKRIIDGVFERLVDDVTSFGGRVDKLLGDGILALFGAPVAHEDDAERAVRAALRMQQTMESAGLVSGLSEPLKMRIGINTGEVLMGSLAGADYTAMGDVVNTAARLQAAAPPGGVLVGEATYALTAQVVRYGDETSLLPRGREQAVSTWLAFDTITVPGVRLRRTDLHLVGRVAELDLLTAAVTMALREEVGVVVNVVGDSGVGKTRIVGELLDRVDGHGAGEAIVLQGSCLPYGETNVWWPIATALAGTLEFTSPAATDDDIRAEVLRRSDEALAGLETPPTAAELALWSEVALHFLGRPSTLDALDPSTRRDTVHRALIRTFELRCQQQPMVLFIDDLHWADPQLVRLLDDMVGSLSRHAFVLVTATRPDSEHEWPSASDRTSTLSIALRPLPRAAADDLARQLLGSVAPSEAQERHLLDKLYERSGGNPLFLQQLADVVVAEGPSSELPDSLRALVAARLDQLPAVERQVLDNAATLGMSGSVSSLERFADAMGQQFDRTMLTELDAKGMLEVRGGRWRFHNDSLRETAYQMLTKSARAMRHAGVAASLASHSPEAVEELAHHAATAAELLVDLGSTPGIKGNLRAEAVRYLTAAARRAHETGTTRSVIRHTSRALALLAHDGAPAEARVPLLLLRSGAYLDQVRFAEARADIEAVLDDAVRRRDATTEGIGRRQLGSLFHLMGDRAAARDELGRSVQLLRGVGSSEALADALRQRGFIELFGGDLSQAEWFFGEAEAQYRVVGDERGLAYVDQHRAWLSFLSGDLTRAEQRLERAATTLDHLGDRNGVGWAKGLLAFVRFYQGRLDEAEELAVTVHAEAVEQGLDWAAGMMLALEAELRLAVGKLDEAAQLADQARSRARKTNDPFGLAQALSPLVRVQVALGRFAAAERTSHEILAIGDDSPAGPIPALTVAAAAMHRGDGRSAWTLTQRALPALGARAVVAFEAHVIGAIASAQTGHLDRARQCLGLLSELDMRRPLARAAAALVAALGGEAAVAVAEAAALDSRTDATYLHRCIAAVASASGHSVGGRPGEATRVLEQSLDEALRVGDVVMTALLQRTYHRLTGHDHPTGSGDQSVLADGWVSLVDALPFGSPTTGT